MTISVASRRQLLRPRMTERPTLAPEGTVRAYLFKPLHGRFNIFYATQRLGCHDLRYVLLSMFEGMNATKPYFSTYFLRKEEGGFLCCLQATVLTA